MILTGQNIPVKFQGSDSYTDGKTITISSNINEKNFDPTVGLALHEASHILKSDFDFLKNLEYNIPAEIFVLAEGKGTLSERSGVDTTTRSENFIAVAIFFLFFSEHDGAMQKRHPSFLLGSLISHPLR